MAGRLESCQTDSVHRLASADAKSLSPQGRGGSVSRRDLNLFAGKRAQLAWALNAKRATKPIPSHSSGGGPGEGKDSHSRQWRLSMAVFLNRNKRPSAAPIEVAELLLEKPPPPEFPPSLNLT